MSDMTLNNGMTLEQSSKVKKSLLYVGIGSIVMLFSGLTSAYVVGRSDDHTFFFTMPDAFTFSTIAIVLSSITMLLASRGAKEGNRSMLVGGLSITLCLGLVFSYYQFEAWTELVEEGIFFGGRDANPSGSFLYVLTGIHLVHLFGGLLSLLYTLVKASKNRYTSEDCAGVQVTGIYWHFLDLLWIYLLLFLLFIR